LNRPDAHTYFMSMAILVSTRGTCPRRRVGCVLVDSNNFVLATGYNGTASGLPHCLDQPCPGAGLASGQGLELCEAVHAESNALTQCRDTRAIQSVYATTAPCVSCTKMLINTSAKAIYYLSDYPQKEAEGLWRRSRPGREWVRWTGTLLRMGFHER